MERLTLEPPIFTLHGKNYGPSGFISYIHGTFKCPRTNFRVISPPSIEPVPEEGQDHYSIIFYLEQDPDLPNLEIPTTLFQTFDIGRVRNSYNDELIIKVRVEYTIFEDFEWDYRSAANSNERPRTRKRTSGTKTVSNPRVNSPINVPSPRRTRDDFNQG